MPVVQKNQLLVQTLLRLFAFDAPPVESATTVIPSHVGADLSLSVVAPLAHATPSMLLPFSS